MPIYVNEEFPDNTTMDIVEAELVWKADEDGIFAADVLAYEIDHNNELAVFQGPKCLKIRQGRDLRHAVALAECFEREAIRNQARGENNRGKKGALL